MSSETVSVPAAVEQPPATSKVSVRDYFGLERSSKERHEYIDGEVVAMAGGTPNHNRIAGNVYFQLRLTFEERACEPFIENIRTRVSATQYRYPDVVAVCGDVKFDTEKPPSLLNPVLVVEVLSPSTESLDRDEKFMEYRQIPTLTDYVLVAQDSVQVIHYARQSERQWIVTIHTDLSETLSLTSIGVELTLADIYRKIAFAASGPSASQPAS